MNSKILKIISVALVLSSFSYAQTDCNTLKGCAEKTCEVNKQIALAKKAENTHKLKGLNEAQEEIKEHCSDDKIISNIRKDLSKANEELAEHQEDLKEAHAEHKSDKIEKYTAKIKEDETEITSLEAKLSKMKSSN